MDKRIRKARRKRKNLKWLHKGKKRLEPIKIENKKDYKEQTQKINKSE